MRLFENIFSLLTLKGVDYVLNFIMLPFLLRTIGAEKFGAIVFMQSVIQYFVLIIDYGFNMTAPRDIARAGNQSEIGRIFSNVMAAKILLLILIAVCSSTAIFFVDVDLKLFIAVFPIVLGNLIFPVWFFQGIQQMKYITISSTIARSSILLLMFVMIHSPADYILAALLQSSLMVVAGILSFVIIFLNHRYVFTVPNIADVKRVFIDGWQIFMSTVAINLYTTTNIVVLGLLTNQTTVGYFSAAMKLIDSVKGLLGAVSNAVFPHISSKLVESKQSAVDFLKRFSRINIGIFFVISLVTFIFAEDVTKILFGNGFDESVQILKIVAWLPFVISISNICGIQTMLNFGMQREFSRILLTAAILDLLTIYPATLIFGSLGTAWISLIVEIFVSTVMIFFVRNIFLRN